MPELLEVTEGRAWTDGQRRLTFLGGSGSADLLPGEKRSAEGFLTGLSSSTAF